MNYELRRVIGSPQPKLASSHLLKDADRSQLMLEFNNAVVSQLDLEGLLKSIFDCIREAFQQTTAATISIYDPEIDQLRVHLLHSDDPDLFKKGMPLPIEGTPSALAFTSRQVVLIHRLVLEEFPADLIKRALADGIKSACSVPLMSRDRVVGVLTVAAPMENAFSEADADLLAQVGLQIAIPIENALNLQQANRQRDRNQLLVEVGEAVTSKQSLKDLFRTVSLLLRRSINHDTATFVLKDRDTGELRLHMLDRPPIDIGREGMVIPMEGTPAGLCITTRSTIRRDTVDFNEFHHPGIRMAYAAGLRSGCSVPLIAGDEVLGAINVGSFREAGFSPEDAELLEQIARPVAIATQNILNFRRAELERDRKRLLLNINNAIITNLSLADLLKAISECLGNMVRHDAASLSLYDPVLKHFRMHTFNFNYESTLQTGMVFPVEGTPAGRVLQTRETLRLPVIDPTEYPADIVQHARSEGLRSACSIPLIVHDQFLGVLEIASRQENAFSEYDAGLLKHIARQIAIATQNTLNFERAQRERERAQTLLEINNAITTTLDLNELIHATAGCLRTYFKNDFAGMSLYDDETKQLKVHSLDSSTRDEYLIAGTRFDIEGTLNGLAFTTGKPVVRNQIDASESSWPLAQKFFAEQGIKAAVFIPMISAERTVGVLNLGSRTENAFSESDVELLVSIAGQIAIAVQNSLNFDRAQKAKERMRILLEANNAVATNLDLQKLLQATSACLREYFNHDMAGIALYDESKQQLIVHAIDRDDESEFATKGTVLPLEGTPIAKAFKTGKAVVTPRIDFDEYTAPDARQAAAEGIKSGCNVPLIAHDRTLGVLGLASKREDAFSEADANLLESIAGQVALAVQNSINFERARDFEQRAARERDRIGLLLEINNALVSNLDLGQVVKTVSASLRDIMPHDAAGIALYEPEHNHLREYTNVSYTEVESFRVGDTIPLDGTPAGEVFTTGNPKLVRRPNLTDYPADRYSQNPVEGSPKSACLALLQAHGRKLGIAGVSSTLEDRFTEEDLEFFSQISGQIALAVENSLQFREIETLKNRLAGEKHYLEEEIKTRYNFSEIVGQSAALKEVLQQIETVAPTDSTVLLIGETGTGKELIARAIHNLSSRDERTLVKLNCAAIPTGLLESELFGHEKGAFTGAIAARVGRFELANKGTLLLDEIGEIPLELQPKLLRVLQEHEFERLGSSRTIKTDARLIASTNCDLAQMVAEKTFRSDLYYRLNVFPIMIPPLRERSGDVPLLVGYFAQKHAARMNKKIQSVPADVMQALCKYHWPGNVRELENFIERSVILSRGADLTSPLSELGMTEEISADGHAAPSKPKLTTMDEMERSYIEEVLRHVNGAVAGKGGAAEILGMPSSTLRSRMKKLGIK